MSDVGNVRATWDAVRQLEVHARAADRRTPEAQDQINAARANPSEAELEAQLSDAALQATPAVREMGGLGPRSHVETLPPSDAGGPGCNHVLWTVGCRPCTEWGEYAPLRPDDLPPSVTVTARLGHSKHGPGGSGLEGPCDPDCAKCEAERQTGLAYQALMAECLNGTALILRGPGAAAYRALEAASQRALAAQIAHQQAGADLRACIEALCRVMAPAPVKDGSG